MTAEIIPIKGDPIVDGLTKQEAAMLIESSPFLKALERHVAELYETTPEAVRAGLLAGHPEK